MEDKRDILRKGSTSVPEVWKIRPNPSYYEGQILSLFIDDDKKVKFPINQSPYLVVIFHSSVCSNVSQLLVKGKIIKDRTKSVRESVFK